MMTRSESERRARRIDEICERIGLPARCRQLARSSRVKPEEIDARTRERLFEIWRDEWYRDIPYGTGGESTWTVDGIANAVAWRIWQELLKETTESRKGVQVVPTDAVDLDSLDGTSARGSWLVIMVPLDDGDDSMHRRWASEAAPEQDPDETIESLYRAVQNAVRTIRDSASLDRIVAAIRESPSLQANLRETLFAIVRGDRPEAFGDDLSRIMLAFAAPDRSAGRKRKPSRPRRRAGRDGNTHEHGASKRRRSHVR